MPQGPRLLAVLLVAFLLVGYVPAGGYAAGAVDGDTGDEPVASASSGPPDAADNVSSDANGDGTEAASDTTSADTTSDTAAADTTSDTTTGDRAVETPTSEASADTTVSDTSDSDDADQESLPGTDDGVTVSNIPGEVEDAVNDTTDEAGDAVDDAEDTVDDAEDDLEDAADDVDETVDDTTDDVEEGIEDTASDVDDATNATELADDTVETTGSALDGTAGTLDHTDLGAMLAVEAPLDTVAVATIDDGAVGVDATVDVGGTTGTSVDGVSETREDRLQSIDDAVAAGVDESSGTDEPTDGASDTESDRSGGMGGVPVPDRTTGSGIAVGAVLVGAALVARNAGTAAVLSALGGSGGSLLATLVSVLRDWIGRVLGIFGYKRYSDDDPLAHETRGLLYEFIRDSPGAYLTEISDETGVTMGTARYHLRILAFENLVGSEEIRGRRRYVPVGTEWAELEAALHDETTARIVETLASEGPDSVSGLADRLDRDPSTISHHLDRLAEDGIVERERDGRAVVNRLAESARIALEDDATAVAGTPVASGAD